MCTSTHLVLCMYILARVCVLMFMCVDVCGCLCVCVYVHACVFVLVSQKTAIRKFSLRSLVLVVGKKKKERCVSIPHNPPSPSTHTFFFRHFTKTHEVEFLKTQLTSKFTHTCAHTTQGVIK